jgi:predicted Zn-ribbon and HTH transcriptional regulator
MSGGTHISIDNCRTIRKLRTAGVEPAIIAEAFEITPQTINFHLRDGCTHPVEFPSPVGSESNSGAEIGTDSRDSESNEAIPSVDTIVRVLENNLIPIRNEWRLACADCGYEEVDAYTIGPCPNCGSAKTSSQPPV